VAKKGVEPHPGVPKVIGPAIFPLKQPRLRCKRKSGLASCIQPRAQFLGQITTKRNQPGTTFTWPNSKACLLQIEIGDTQTERFPRRSPVQYRTRNNIRMRASRNGGPRRSVMLRRRSWTCLGVSMHAWKCLLTAVTGSICSGTNPSGSIRLRYKQNCRMAVRSLLLVSGRRSGSALSHAVIASRNERRGCDAAYESNLRSWGAGHGT